MLLALEGESSPAIGFPPVYHRASTDSQSRAHDGRAFNVQGATDTHQRLRVAYVSAADPHDRRSWSGTHFRILESLRPFVSEITSVRPLVSNWRRPLAALGKLSRSLTGKRYAHECSPLIAADYGRQIDRHLTAGSYDVILAPAASSEISTLATSIPIVYLSDATFALMRDYYPKFAEMQQSSQRAGDHLDRTAIHRATRVIYPSKWAARSAIDDYQADPARIIEIPFGANFDLAPLARVRSAPTEGRCRMLFVGKGWARKGGPLALDALRILRARGLDATLTVVGCPRPDSLAERDEPGVEFIANIDKRDPAGEQRLKALYEQADIFVLPTRAECYGVVFCEAAAYGLPIVATSTGGIPSAVTHGTNGLLLHLNADATAYANAVESIVANRHRYVAMAAASRRLFDETLNWNAFGRRCSQVLQDAVDERATVLA